MTSRTVGGTVRPYSYSDPAHKDAPTSYNGTNYTYDANGSQVGTSAGQSRTFDPEGRLSSISDGTGSTSTFVYDAGSSRILKSVTAGGTTTRTLYVSAYEEQLGSGSISYYSFGGKGVGLRRSGWPSGNGQYRLVGDQLGSTTLLVDTATPPTVVQRQYHKPYGEIAWQWTASGSLTDVGFTGQRLDSDSGLMYYGARFYDPALGYFVSADTIGVSKGVSQSRNRYAYVLNNPLSHTDPSGQCTDDDTGCHASNRAEQIAADKAALEELGFSFDETCDGCLHFSLLTLDTMLAGVRALMAAAGWTSPEQFRAGIGLTNGQTITVRATDNAHMTQLTKKLSSGNGCVSNAPGCTVGTNIVINQELLSAGTFLAGEETFVHELGHAWSSIHQERTGESLASGMFHFTHYQVGRDEWVDREIGISQYARNAGEHGEYSQEEDWAETVAALAFHDVDPRLYGYWTAAQERRYFIQQHLHGH